MIDNLKGLVSNLTYMVKCWPHLIEVLDTGHAFLAAIRADSDDYNHWRRMEEARIRHFDALDRAVEVIDDDGEKR